MDIKAFSSFGTRTQINNAQAARPIAYLQRELNLSDGLHDGHNIHNVIATDEDQMRITSTLLGL